MTVGQFQSHLAELTTAAGGSAITVDWAANGFSQNVPLSAASCTLTFTPPKTDAILLLRLTQDGTGGRQVVLPGSVVGSFALGLALNSSTVVTLFYTKGVYYVITSSTVGSNVYRNTYYVNSAFAGPGTGTGTSSTPFTTIAACVAADPLGALVFLPPFSVTTENFVSPTGPTGWDFECQSLLSGPCTISGTLTLTSSGGVYALKNIIVTGNISGVATSTRNQLYIDGCLFGGSLSLSGSGSWLVSLAGFGPPKSHQSGYFNGAISIVGTLYATDWEFVNSVSATGGGALNGCQFDSGATAIAIGAALLIQNTTFAAAPTFTGAAVVTMDGFSHASAVAAGGPILAGGATLVILNDVSPSGVQPGSNTQVLTTVAGVAAWATPVAGLALATTAPADVTKAAAAVGTGATAARVDHKHDVTTAAASTAVAIGNAASEGTSAALARADHGHPVAAAGVPVDVGTANSAGAATTFAASNHVHNTPFSAVAAALAAASSAFGVNAQRITNVADPTSAQDAATKAYVDALAQGLSVKPSVIALENATNVASLSGLTTAAGGVLLNTDGMRVALGAQTTGSQTGIYAVHAGAWTRVTDYAAGSHAAGTFFFVEEGTNANGGFVCASVPGSDLVGTNTLAFTQFSGAGEIVAGIGLTKSANTLAIGFSSQVQGNFIYFNGTAWVLLAPDTAGKFLSTQGSGANPSWVTLDAGNVGDTASSVGGPTIKDSLNTLHTEFLSLTSDQVGDNSGISGGGSVTNALLDLLLEYPRGTYPITAGFTLDLTNIGKLGLVTAVSSVNVAIPTGGTPGTKFDILLYASGSALSTSANAGVNAHNLTFQANRYAKVTLECVATNEWVISWTDVVALAQLSSEIAAWSYLGDLSIPLVGLGGIEWNFSVASGWTANGGGDVHANPIGPIPATRDLTELIVRISPVGGHGALPVQMPTLVVHKVDGFGTVSALGSATDSSVSVAAYELPHDIVVSGLSAMGGGGGAKSFFFVLTAENGTNAVNGCSLVGASMTLST